MSSSFLWCPKCGDLIAYTPGAPAVEAVFSRGGSHEHEGYAWKLQPISEHQAQHYLKRGSAQIVDNATVVFEDGEKADVEFLSMNQPSSRPPVPDKKRLDDLAAVNWNEELALLLKEGK